MPINVRSIAAVLKCQVLDCRAPATIEATLGDSAKPQSLVVKPPATLPFGHPTLLYLCTEHAADLSVKLEETTADLSPEHKQ